jgi:hypothetical protein
MIVTMVVIVTGTPRIFEQIDVRVEFKPLEKHLVGFKAINQIGPAL